MPIVVGNSVRYNTALELMETGISGLLTGVGPGAACTSREVLGIGVPQISAILEIKKALNGKDINIIADGVDSSIICTSPPFKAILHAKSYPSVLKPKITTFVFIMNHLC